MTNTALRGKPDAGNPHVRFDEGEVAPAATPRRGSLLYKKKLQDAIKGMQVESWEVREHSRGTRKVYVRFAQRKPVVTVDVNQSED